MESLLGHLLVELEQMLSIGLHFTVLPLEVFITSCNYVITLYTGAIQLFFFFKY